MTKSSINYVLNIRVSFINFLRKCVENLVGITKKEHFAQIKQIIEETLW